MPEIKLKPCPFCGGRGRIMRAGNNAYVVRCKECGTQTPRSFIKDWHRNKYIAQGNDAGAWNHRVDAQAIKHGKWKFAFMDAIYEETYCCSVCGEIGYPEANYCPNCGAKMILEE